jgi:hypothetical protein
VSCAANRNTATSAAGFAWHLVSACWIDRPVMLPPGRVKLVTKAAATGSMT